MGLQNTSSLRGRQLAITAAQELLNSQECRMLRDAQVRPTEISQAVHAAVGKLNVHVHTSRTDEGRVQPLWVIGGEDEDALRA